ncbi:MAG: SHOCT domain-containing protein [Methylovirgula sp.]
MWGYGTMMNGWGSGNWWGPFGMFIGLIILVVVIAGIIWFVRTASQSDGRTLSLPRRPSGLDILEERYARGEINREEYMQKKRDLSG